MANERGADQKLIPIPASESFIKELNLGFKAAGYTSRSQFIRDAIVDKLHSLGIRIPKGLAAAPDRLGVGGRSRMASQSYSLNDKPNSAKSAGAVSVGQKLVANAVSYSLKRGGAKKAPPGKTPRKAKAVHPATTPPVEP